MILDNGAGKIPPQAVDAEEAVLGAILQFKKAIDVIAPILSPDNFYKEPHQIIYRSCIELHNSFQPIDIITVTHHLKGKGELELVGGPFYITQLTNKIMSAANIEFHGRIILQQSLKRDLIYMASESIKEGYDDSNDILHTLDGVSKKIDKINNHTLTQTRRIGLKNELDERSDIVTFMGKSFLSVGNVAALVAHPGIGKSNVMDAIAANSINNNCDGLGFKVNLYGKKIYQADTERSYNDSVKGYRRTVSRIDIERWPDLSDGEFIVNYDMDMYKEIPDHKLRRQMLQRAIYSKEYSLVLIDGVSDFCKGVNEDIESQEFIGWLGAVASKFSVAILVTIHDNPKSQTKGAPRGHLGSELQRKVEGLLKIDNVEKDKEVKYITNDFEFGKLRNDGGAVENYFRWDQDKHMFTSINFTPTKENEKLNVEIRSCIDRILVGGRKIDKTQLSKEIKSESGKAIPTAYKWIDKAEEKGWIERDEKGLYNNGSTPF